MVDTIAHGALRATSQPAPVRHAAGRASLPVLERYRLRPDARLEERDGGIAIHAGRWEATMHDLGRARREVLRRLDDGWLDDTELAQVASRFGGEQDMMSCHLLVQSLARRGWLSRALHHGGRDLVEIVPHFMGRGRGRGPNPKTFDPDQTYALSRHCAIEDVDGRFALRPVDWLHTAVVDDARLVGALAASLSGWTVARLSAAAGLDDRAGARVLAALVECGVLVRPDEQGGSTYWGSDELRLHARSRAGGHTLPIGATFRFRDRLGAEPLAKHPPAGNVVALPAAPARRDGAELPFDAVVAARRSIREHDDDAPIRLDQLGEFLRRTQFTTPTGTAGEQEVGRRPYPSAGRICELETYLLVNRCDGLAGGLYWYDSLQHHLRHVAEPGPLSDRMLNYARAASASDRSPQVLCVITSRMARLAWKYEGLAYSMSLRGAGVLLGHMYLVATAMGLAPCALGTGDSDAFAALAGIDPLDEPCVADFMLGSVGQRS